MKKRKVLQFGVLFLTFVVLLGVLHFLQFGGLTGFVILGPGDELISSDDFECNGFNCGSGWSGAWSFSGGCEITGLGGALGSFHMRGDAGCDAERNFDASSYNVVNLTFYATAQSLEDGEFCYYYYYNGLEYTQLLSLTNGDDDITHDYYEFDVAQYGVASNSGIRMKSPPSGADYCAIDDINIIGKISDSTPPEVTVNLPVQGKFYSTSSFNFNVSLNENGSVIYSLDFGVNNISMLHGANLIGREFNHTNSSLGDGSYTFSVYANDSNGNNNYTKSVSFSVDTISPSVSIVNPSALNYSNIQSELNYSVSDSNLGSCWYSLDEGVTNVSVSCGSNVTGLTSNQGNNLWSVYANDSAGNNNYSESVEFFVDSIGPSVSIIHPQAKTYGINESLPLNFSISDTNLESCWYSVDSGDNSTLGGCSNSTFNVTGDGNHNLNLYANDSFGNVNSDSVAFSVVTGAPAINLVYPENNSFINYGSDVYLNYSVVSGIGVSSCGAWGDFSGVWGLNQSNSSISLENNFFVLNLNDDNYNWGVICNDTQNRASGINGSFGVDTITPSVELTGPSGTQTSRTDIGVTFSATDLNGISCVYNVYRGAVLELANTSVSCGIGVDVFDVTVDGDFVLNFYANDSAGNIGSDNIIFSVDTSSGGGSGGSGGGSSGGSSGGGGGGSAILPSSNGTKKLNIEFEIPGEIVLKRGTSDNFKIGVINKDVGFLNTCELEFNEGGGEWLKSEGNKGFSRGERYVYDVSLNVPNSVEPGSYNPNVILKCREGSSGVDFDLRVYRNIYDGEILDYERIGNKLRVNYSLEEFGGEGRVIGIDYSLVDFDGVERTKGKSGVELGAREFLIGVLEFDLPKDSFGEFEFLMRLSDGTSEVSFNKGIFLPSQGLTGFPIFGADGRRLSIAGAIVVFLILAVVVWKFIYNYHKRSKKNFVGGGGKRKRKRKLWEIEL